MSGRYVDNRMCMIDGCGARAVRWLKNVDAYAGRGLCQEHYEEVGQLTVRYAMEDPEIRSLLGLDRQRRAE